MNNGMIELNPNYVARDVIIPSFSGSVFVLAIFPDMKDSEALEAVCGAIDKIQSGTKIYYIDAEKNMSFIREISAHISKVNQISNNATSKFDLEFHSVNLLIPSMVVFQNGDTAFWYSGFDRNVARCKQFIFENAERLRLFEAEDINVLRKKASKLVIDAEERSSMKKEVAF